jgi:hypothetical protein
MTTKTNMTTTAITMYPGIVEINDFDDAALESELVGVTVGDRATVVVTSSSASAKIRAAGASWIKNGNKSMTTMLIKHDRTDAGQTIVVSPVWNVAGTMREKAKWHAASRPWCWSDLRNA